MKQQFNHLALSWSVSKGRDTYGYNICRLDDRNEGQRFKCMGGGYDMVGTVFAQWLCCNFQARLLAIKDRASTVFPKDGAHYSGNSENSLYGMRYHEKDDRIYIDGACGLDCVLRIADIIGLDVQRDYIAKGRRRGETIGWFISEKE